GDDLRQPRKFSRPLQHWKPRLLSEAKENGEGPMLTKASENKGREHVGRRSSPVTGYQWTTGS
ncbi:MAG: hypothetical protein ACKVE3_07810, partial [Dissulfuribacterales bacterium]